MTAEKCGISNLKPMWPHICEYVLFVNSAEAVKVVMVIASGIRSIDGYQGHGGS